MNHAVYLDTLFYPDDLKDHAQKIAIEIEKDKNILGINSIAITGVSGLVIGGIISCEIGLPLIIVRKQKSKHSDYMVEFPNDLTVLNYCFVDDVIGEQGKTVKRVIKLIEKANPEYKNCLKKMYLYSYNRAYPDRFYLNKQDEKKDKYIPIFKMQY